MAWRLFRSASIFLIVVQQTFGFLLRGCSVGKVADERAVDCPLLNVTNTEAIQTLIKEIRTLTAIGRSGMIVGFLFDIHFSCFSFSLLILSISLNGCLRQLFSLPSSNPFLYAILHQNKNAYKNNSHRIITTTSIISIISNIHIHFYSLTSLKIISSFNPKRSCAKATQKELQYWYLPCPNAHFSHELPAVAMYFLPFMIIPFSLVIAFYNFIV